ncbi:CST complex subunit TEN1 [Acrasis kona]|uniref:TEN1 n=1 Tax=Acrasis kona TaxID=1008807 RepID=A0AAW2YH10_9EUKA
MKTSPIKSIQEITQESHESGDSVRTYGRLVSYEMNTNKASISHKNFCLDVDVEFLVEFKAQQGAYYTFIGELYSTPKTFLKARIFDIMEEYDNNVFEKIIAARKEIFQS